jgi:protein O-mannosyl-transferase
LNSKKALLPVINLFNNSLTSLPLIALLILICFSPLLKAGFIFFDDDILLTKNEFVKHIGSDLFVNAFSLKNIIHYHPLVFLTFAGEYFLFGLYPFYFHFANLLLHIFNTFLVYRLLSALAINNKITIAAMLLFALHPLHVESVAWVAELKDLLYSFFFISSAYVYLKYLKSQQKWFYFLSLFLFFLSCLSKAMAVTLPFILILFEYKLSINFRKYIAGKIPFFVLSAVFIIINLNVAYYNFDLMVFSPYERIILVFYSLLFYPFKAIFPFSQSAIYAYPVFNNLILYMIPIFCISLLFILFKIKDKTKTIKFGLLFYIITVLPVLPVLPFGISYIADRFVYIPIIGLFIIVLKIAENILKKYSYLIYKPVYCIYFLTSAIILTYGIASYSRCLIWKDTGTLMKDVIEKDNESYHAYYILASYYYENNDFGNSISCYNSAVKLRPGFACTYFNLGNVYVKAGQFYKAIENYNIAVKLNPIDKEAYNNMGLAFEYLGDYNNALKYYSISAEMGYEPARDVLLKLKQ